MNKKHLKQLINEQENGLLFANQQATRYAEDFYKFKNAAYEAKQQAQAFKRIASKEAGRLLELYALEEQVQHDR